MSSTCDCYCLHSHKMKDNKILNSESEKLLDMAIDNNHNFNNHLQKYLKKLIKKFMFSKNHTIYKHS